MELSKQLTALQNFANKFDLKVEIVEFQDNRKKPKFFLSKGRLALVQPLNYNEMNLFLLGINNAKYHNL